MNIDKFAIKWIPVKNLSVVWQNTQRDFDDKWAKTIAAQFDPDLFGVLSVTLPNGNGIYHCIDGQHRKAAVQSLYGDNELVPCRIFDATEPQRAADMFIKNNTGRKPLRHVTLFNTAVTAGYEIETAVDKIVRRMGYKVGTSSTDGIIKCPSALVSIYKSFGAKTLTDTLAVLQETFGKDHNALGTQLIRGYGAFIAEYHEANLQRLIDRVQKKYTPGRLIGASRSIMESWRISAAESVKEVLVNTYNYGLKTGKLERSGQ